MCWYKKNWHPYVKSFKKLIFGGPFRQARSQNGIWWGRKNLGGQKNLGGKKRLRHEMHEILLKITSNWNHSGGQSKIWGALPLSVPPLATSLIWRGLCGVVPSDPSKLCACARAHSFQRLRTDILLTDTLLHMGCSSSIAHISHFKKSAHTHQNFCKHRLQKIRGNIGGTLKPS